MLNVEVECPETARCPPHSSLAVFSTQSPFEVYLEIPEFDVAVDFPVDIAVLDHDAHLVDLDVGVVDGHLRDVLVDLLTLDALDVLPLISAVCIHEIYDDVLLFSAVHVVVHSDVVTNLQDVFHVFFLLLHCQVVVVGNTNLDCTLALSVDVGKVSVDHSVVVIDLL